MHFLSTVFHLAQRVLLKLPPSVAILVSEAVSLAERSTDSKGTPLDGASKNQLATELVSVGVDALNAELKKHGAAPVTVDAEQISECVSELVDTANAVVKAIDSARSKVATSSGVQLSSVEAVEAAKGQQRAAETQRKSLLS